MYSMSRSWMGGITISEEEIDEAMGNVHITDDLSAAVDGADYIQECLWEDIEHFDWQRDETCLNAMQRVEKLFSEAFATFTNDEYAAQAQLRFSNYRTVMERYPNTQAWQSIRGRCDSYKDYHAEVKRFAYLVDS